MTRLTLQSKQKPRGDAVAALRRRTLHLMLSGDDASLADVLRVIRNDPNLSRTLLEEASSRQDTEARPVFHLRRAVQLLGFRRIRTLLESRTTAV